METMWCTEKKIHPQDSVHPNEISSHPSIISPKNINIYIVKLLRFRFKYGMRLVIYTRTKIFCITFWEEII